MRKKDRDEVLELLYKELNNLKLEFYNDSTFAVSNFQRRGFIKAIEAIRDMETED